MSARADLFLQWQYLTTAPPAQGCPEPRRWLTPRRLRLFSVGVARQMTSLSKRARAKLSSAERIAEGEVRGLVAIDSRAPRIDAVGGILAEWCLRGNPYRVAEQVVVSVADALPPAALRLAVIRDIFPISEMVSVASQRLIMPCSSCGTAGRTQRPGTLPSTVHYFGCDACAERGWLRRSYPWADAPTVQQLAAAIRTRPGERLDASGWLPLHDALIDAGCEDQLILAHCRQPLHVRGCWLLDYLAGVPLP